MLIIVLITNCGFLTTGILGGFALKEVLRKDGNGERPALVLYTGIVMIAFGVLALIMIAWNKRSLRIYFTLQFRSQLGLETKIGEKDGDGMANLPHRFVLKISDSYFNRDHEVIKEKIAKRNMLKKFVRDIQKEPELQSGPSRIKRYDRDANGEARHLTIKRMDSMHDIKNNDLEVGSNLGAKDTVKELMTPLKSPMNKTPKSKNATPGLSPKIKTAKNSVAPTTSSFIPAPGSATLKKKNTILAAQTLFPSADLDDPTPKGVNDIPSDMLSPMRKFKMRNSISVSIPLVGVS